MQHRQLAGSHPTSETCGRHSSHLIRVDVTVTVAVLRSLSGEDRITHSRTKHEEIGTSTASISRLLLCAKVREPPVDDLADDLDCHPGSPRSPLVDSACEWRSAARCIAEAAAAVRASCAMSLSLRSSLGSTPAIPWQLLVASGLACRKRLGVAERSGYQSVRDSIGRAATAAPERSSEGKSGTHRRRPVPLLELSRFVRP